MRPLAASLLLALAACSPLRTFNALVPKDTGVVLAAKGARFAPGDRGTLDLYAPKRMPAGKRLPVIVFFYGGSWNSGDKAGYGFVGRALAARGFLVAIPDYRLVPEIHYPEFLADGAAAVRWVRSNAIHYGGDPDRLVLAGHSAGAYNAAMLSLDPQWLGRDREAVSGFVGLAGPYDFLPLDGPITRNAFGRAPDLRATQPVNLASPGDPPALLLVAGEDRLVYPRNSKRLAAALTKAGVPVETKIYPNIGHVGIVTAFSTLFRRKAPVVRDVTDFARSVTDEALQPERRRASSR